MSIPLLTSVKLNGVETAGVYLMSYKCLPTFGYAVQECTVECAFSILGGIPDLDNGVSILITRGFTTVSDEIVFSGFVDRIDKQGSSVVVYGKDKASILSRTIVNYSYNGQSFSDEAKGSDIAKDLIEVWGGLSASVVDTGSVILLKNFNCKYVDVMSRLQTLADIYDYQIYYDPVDDKVHFEPKGYVTNSVVIYVGGTNSNVSGSVKWLFDNTQCVNKILVRGASQVTSQTELFNGGTNIFTLLFNPITVNVSEYLGGSWVTKVGGVLGSIVYYDYSVDAGNKTVNASVNWSPAVGVGNVQVVYTYGLPADIILEDKNSIAAYGLYYSVKYFNDIATISDAEARGNHFLSQYSTPFVQSTIQLAGLISFNIGDFVNVVDTVNGENRLVTVNQIEKSYPSNGDKISVGDKQWRISDWGKMTVDRLRRLEEENNTDAGIYITVLYLNHQIDIQRSYCLVQTETLGATGFILDKDDYDVLDTDVLEDNPFGSPVTKRIVWFNNVYTETFLSTDFKGVGSGTWSTNNLNVAVGEDMSSLVFYTNGKNVTGARLSIVRDNPSFSLLLYLSVDGVNWEIVTSGVSHVFSNVGTGLYWKVANVSGSGSTNISSVIVDNIVEA